MRSFSLALLFLLPLFSAVGCAHQCPKGVGTKSAAVVTAKKKVRTTAYTAHEPGGARGAAGKRLKVGAVTSAAADWSLYPLGTKFRLLPGGQIYEIDDYGSALVGKNTIDLFQTSGSAMRNWGVRNVEIEVLEWGSAAKSLEILQPRTRCRHVRVMVSNLRDQLGEG